MLYRFDEFELDTATYSLRRGGEPLRIEPKVFELLVTLLRARARLVTKDELIEAVWDGQFLSDAALSRCVYQARRSLGDDSTRQLYLKTVHGRGYRFNDQVTVREEAAGTDPEPADRQPTAPVEEEPVATDVAPAAPAESSAPGSPARSGGARPSGNRRSLPLMLALLALAVLVTGLLIWGGGGGEGGEGSEGSSAAPAGVATRSLDGDGLPTRAGTGERTSIAVLWSADEREGEAALVGLSLGDLLRQRLRQIDSVSIRELEGSLDEALAEHRSLVEVARAVGAELLLTGKVAPSASRDRFTARVELFDLRHGRVLGSPLGSFELPRLSRTADLDDFIQVREAIVGEITGHLGVLAEWDPDDPLRPKDAEAYRLFLLALQSLLRDFCSGAAALELLERSLEIDSEFAVGWLALATAHYNRVWACGAETSAYDEALVAAARAQELVPDQPAPALLRVAILSETGRAEEGWVIVRDLAEAHPSEPLVFASQIYVLTYAGFLQRAEALVEELLRREPLYYGQGAAGESPTALLYLGHLERFLEILPDAEAAYHRYYRGFAHVLRGDRKAAAEALEPAFRNNPGDVFGRLASALLAIVEDDRPAALRIVEELSRQRRQLGNPDGEITYKEAQLFALAGDAARALDRLEVAIAQGFFCSRCIAEDPAMAELRDRPRFDQALQAARRRHEAFAERMGLAAEPL